MPSRSVIFDQLRKRLPPHLCIEEEIFYPPLTALIERLETCHVKAGKSLLLLQYKVIFGKTSTLYIL